jgi:hypothetical protein
MDTLKLEFLLRRTHQMGRVLFGEGDIVENAEKGEDAEDKI